MTEKEIVAALREHAEWAQANEWERLLPCATIWRKPLT